MGKTLVWALLNFKCANGLASLESANVRLVTKVVIIVVCMYCHCKITSINQEKATCCFPLPNSEIFLLLYLQFYVNLFTSWKARKFKLLFGTQVNGFKTSKVVICVGGSCSIVVGWRRYSLLRRRPERWISSFVYLWLGKFWLRILKGQNVSMQGQKTIVKYSILYGF